MGGMLRLQLYRAFTSKNLPYIMLALLSFAAICFVQSCVMFWGHETSAVPSAAAMWPGYGRNSNTSFFLFIVNYLLFPLTAALFADSLFVDRSRGSLPLLTSRSSWGSYVASGLVATFASAFLATLAVLVASQLLALLAFPAGADADAYFSAIDMSASSNLVYHFYDEAPFASLIYHNRYLFNLLYATSVSLWAGTLACTSYAASLYIRNNRLVVIGLPTMAFLATSAIAPAGIRPASLLLPSVSAIGMPGMMFLAIPLAVLFLDGIAAVVALKRRKGLMT